MAASSSYDKAVQLLSRRSHFRRELERKLSGRGYPQDEVEETLERLERLRFLDDRETARELVTSRLARGPLGRRRLAAELARKGADRDLADQVLDEMLPEDDRPSAREAARRWLDRKRGTPDPRALARHLERKGFSRRAIFTALEDLGLEDFG